MSITISLKSATGDVNLLMADRQASPSPALHLPDKIPTEVHTLFVGINPAVRSAEVGHYYAHPTNMFWKLITASGISPVPVTARDDDLLVKHGFGFTDVAKRPTASAGELENAEFLAARQRLTDLIIEKKPKTVVFVSKRSARAFLQAGPAEPITYGRQPDAYHGATIWFLPSTSGQSNGDSSYEEKLAAFEQLAQHVATYCTWGRRQSQSTFSPVSQAWGKARQFLRRGSAFRS
jgi:double-stranded uracil-DNA glycosylase